jgi:hypothetical protein
VLQDLLVAALDAPGDQPAAGFAHQLQHFFVHVIDPAVAGPLDVDVLSIISLHSSITCSRLTVNRSAYMWMLLMPSFFQHPQLFHDQLWRAQAHAVLVADVLDAVGAARRAAAAGDDEGERPLISGMRYF